MLRFPLTLAALALMSTAVYAGAADFTARPWSYAAQPRTQASPESTDRQNRDMPMMATHPRKRCPMDGR